MIYVIGAYRGVYGLQVHIGVCWGGLGLERERKEKTKV